MTKVEIHYRIERSFEVRIDAAVLSLRTGIPVATLLAGRETWTDDQFEALADYCLGDDGITWDGVVRYSNDTSEIQRYKILEGTDE